MLLATVLSLMHGPTTVWSASGVVALASAAALSGVILKDGSDLKDQGRPAGRNLLQARLCLQEASFVFSRDVSEFARADCKVLVGLSSLAMGDSSACGYAQAAHLGVLVAGDVLFPGELLMHGSPPPKRFNFCWFDYR